MPSDFGNAARRVSDLRDDLARGHEQATEKAMQLLRTEVRRIIRANDSMARRVLVSDVRHDDVADTSKLVEQTVSTPWWSKYLEHGTGQVGDGGAGDESAYKAPDPVADIDAIETWVVQKAITPEYYASQEELAGAIAHTIGEIGNFPHPFMRPAWRGANGKQAIIEANKQAMRTALRRF